MEEETRKKGLSIRRCWIWVVVAIVLGAIFFITYIPDPALCEPCPPTMVDCPPCPVYQQSLFQYLTR